MVERKEKDTKGNYDLKKRSRNITTCLYLLFSFLKALQYSSEDLSSQLESAVKGCSYSEVLVSSGLVKGLA